MIYIFNYTYLLINYETVYEIVWIQNYNIKFQWILNSKVLKEN